MQDAYAYNRWANGVILDAVAALDADAFTRDLGNSFKSVRDTLDHIAWGEWLWLRRVRYGESPRDRWTPSESVSDLRGRWRAVQDEWSEYVEALPAGELDRNVTYVNSKDETWTYPVRQILVHLTHHSAYHRGQVVTMLRQLGASAPSTDFLVWIDVNGTRPLVSC